MSSRLDRLLVLLDTGSSTSVRTTAAKQLAQLAAKSIRSDVGGNDDVNKLRIDGSLVGDASAWSELMSVVARVSHGILDICAVFELTEKISGPSLFTFTIA